jgi:type IV pilus assembly protein PilW
MTAKIIYSPLRSIHGFTLVELLIAIIVTSIVGIAMVSNSISQQRAATNVKQTAQMQQQLRGAIYIMEEDIRIAGYDPQATGLFGITDVRRYSITNEATAPVPVAAPLGWSSLTLAYDWDPNNAAATGDGLLNEPTCTYRLFDDNSDNIFDLVRDNGALPRPFLVAEGIQAIGFAFAIDADNPNADLLARTANGNVIWAVDSNNDNLLDTNIDTNDDGTIDINDAGANFVIESADGPAGVLNPPIGLDRIRAVRIWMVARARTADPQFNNTDQFAVGDRVVPAQAGGFQDNFRRQLLDHTVQFRYMGM